jgi:hypothetical protein
VSTRSADRAERDAQRRAKVNVKPTPYIGPTNAPTIRTQTPETQEAVGVVERARSQDNMGYGDRVVDLRPEEDFGPEASRRRELARELDYSDTRRAYRRAIEVDLQQSAEEEGFGSEPVLFTPTPAQVTYIRRQELSQQEEAVIAAEAARSSGGNFENFRTSKMLVESAKASGVDLTKNDIKNLVDFGIANDAASKLVELARNEDSVGMNNVMLTLQETNPVAAGFALDIVEEKLKEAVKDPTWVENTMASVMEGVGFVLQPLMVANEAVQHRIRAAQWNDAQNSSNPEFAWRHQLYGAFSENALAATEVGKYNKDYLRQIIDSGKYDPLQIQIALDISNAAANGDSNAITNVWQDKYSGNDEAAAFIRDIAYGKADGNSQELLRQIDSAYLGNTGQVAFGASDPDAEYDPFRGTTVRQDLANATGFGISLAVDPTLAGAKAVKMYRAMRWGLDRLAPGSGPADEVLGKLRLGRMEITTPAYRYFNGFANDLNKLNDLEKRAAEAVGKEKAGLQVEIASQRAIMSRQYDEMPEDLIEDFRNSTWREPDGKFTVETLSAAIDDMNSAYITSVNGINARLVAMGAKREELREAMIAVRTSPNATPKQIKEAEEAFRSAQDAQRKIQGELFEQRSFRDRVASTNEKRVPLVPRESMAARLRKDAVNRLAFNLMPEKRAAKLADEYLSSSGDPKVFSKALSDNAIPLGADQSAYKKTAGAFIDNLGRMFSSIPSTNVINVTSAKDTTSVYRYSRMFFTKRTSQMIAEAFRQGDEGSRRLLLSGLIRAGMTSRGVNLSDGAIDNFAGQLNQSTRKLITGSNQGEKYGVSVPANLTPSQRALGITPEVTEDGDTLFRSLSTDSNGIEHAIHLSQTADNVALPTIRDIEEFRNSLRKNTTSVLETATNWWSIATLYGLRFSMRNAIEEVGLYWATGGRLTDLYRGRKLDQAIRRIRPQITVEVVDNSLTPVYKSSLGMIASRANNASLWLKHKGFPEWMAELVYKGIDNDMLEAANVQLAKGNTEAFGQLAVESLATQKIFGLSTNLLRPSDKIAFKYLTDSTHGMSILDEIGEAGKYLNSGGFPAYVDESFGISDVPPGVEYGKINSSTSRMGGYANIRPIAVDESRRKVYGSAFWWRELQTTIDGDGPIGQAAVRYLNDPVRAKAEIARIIREDKTYKYKERFSRLQSQSDIDSFSDDYFENVFQHFTKSDGSLNLDLRARFIDIDENGEEVVSWWRPVDETGEKYMARISRDDLASMKTVDTPEYIFGREAVSEPYIPMPINTNSLLSSDRIYGWMGRQNARISRDPIFLANYIDQFEITEGARKSLALALAKSRGDDVASAADNNIAEMLYARQSMDNAFNLTLSYIDNPANRSNLAWKARNLSRYYRATEDFYRRIKRVVLNDPTALWKASLTYQLLGEYGFVYEDDNGDKYFAYPGNEQLQAALAGGIAIPGTDMRTPGLANLFGIDMKQYIDLDPFSINGKLLGIAPSTDPNQALPSLMGPTTAPLAAVFTQFPQFGGLRTALLGQYSQPSDNPLAAAFQAILPAGVAKILRATDPDQLDSWMAESVFNTIALMGVEGMLDEYTINGKPYVDALGNKYEPGLLPIEQFTQTDQYQVSQVLSMSSLILRVIGGFTVPAAPQVVENNASDFAKRYGIDSMSDLYRDLLQKKMDEEHPSPLQTALSEFYSLQYGKMRDSQYAGIDTFLPFTTSLWKDNPDNPGASLALIRASDNLTTWFEQPETKEIESKYKDVYMFLAPSVGEFTWESWNIITNVKGLKVKKSLNERISDGWAIQGQVNENFIRGYYDQQIKNAPTPDEVSRITDEKAEAIRENREANPYFKRQKDAQNPVFSRENINNVLYRTKDMLNFIEQRDGKLSVDATEIANAIFIYESYKKQTVGLQGTGPQKQAVKKRISAQMTAELDEIKLLSPNAKQFIEAVISQDPDYEYGVQEVTE